MGIDFSRDGRVATVRINRPEKLNALTLSMYEDLGRAFQSIKDDDAIHSAVLLGSGDRAFCVGADLKESIPALSSDAFDISAWDPAHIKFSGFYKPVVCGIRGFCLGAGFELMLATDIRIVAHDAIFQLPEPTMGFVPAGGTLVRLVRQIAYAHAMEIMLTARRFSAAEMVTRGVANQAVDSQTVEEVAVGIAQTIADLSPTAIQTIKEAALTLQDLPLADAFRSEATLGQRTFTSEDAKRGLAAFASKGS